MSTSYANLLSTSHFHKISPKLPSYSLPLQALCLRRSPRLSSSRICAVPTAVIPTEGEVLPTVLDSSSDPPPLFDGTTRCVFGCMCNVCFSSSFYQLPDHQSLLHFLKVVHLLHLSICSTVWIARNYKGLQEKIKLVPLDLENRPSWYKERVYPPNKVPSLEHDNDVRGESLDLMKYIDSCFEGPVLYPNDPARREFAEELLSYTDTFNRAVLFSLKGESINEISSAFDYLETALFKFNDGPFFLGQFSLVDIAYAPFIERFHPLLLDVKKYDITAERPMLKSWIEDMNKKLKPTNKPSEILKNLWQS